MKRAHSAQLPLFEEEGLEEEGLGPGAWGLSPEPRAGLLRPGDLVPCYSCRGKHPLEPATGGATAILFYRCGETAHVGAVQGRLARHGLPRMIPSF